MNTKTTAGSESIALLLPSIILVDDDPIFGRLMLAAAERRGIVLTYCSSVRERYRAVDWNCDLIITDYDLGRVTGIQLSNYLQNHLSHLPILIVSAYKQIDTRGWPPSVKGFLQKQIGPNAILDEAIRKR